MLARRLTTILPAMTLAEALETTCVPRVAGRIISGIARERQRISGAYHEDTTSRSC
jgi:predicted ATPase with chaperone activity